jgi:hypothetical protein
VPLRWEAKEPFRYVAWHLALPAEMLAQRAAFPLDATDLAAIEEGYKLACHHRFRLADWIAAAIATRAALRTSSFRDPMGCERNYIVPAAHQALHKLRPFFQRGTAPSNLSCIS